ncbi:hypothetical protein CBR_g17714 [Chara braunii]|uniref:RNA-directed DNA polymerase n=1 Tax=Chara braunii TaxID=69332 RepID=A0A388KVA5_CHABU|nr:hypothetical protein CBR_g17714 [Chara braunii]|eukprot:GBG74004.1 hypothetical protein CBR_g17714 [Chara braunii]
MVDLRSGKSTSPCTLEQQEKMAALVRENKERKELEKQVKLKAIAEEQAAKMKRLEEEMKRVQQEEEERRKAGEEEAAAEEEKEGKRIEGGEGSSGTKRDTDAKMEKRISEWVANLSLGEDEEAESYVTQDERDALASELAAMEDPMERRERDEEQKLAWKLRMKREKKRRREEVNKLTAEVAKVQDCRKEVQAQANDKAKWDKVLGYLEVLSTAWMEKRQASWSQEVALSAMRSGFRDFARDIVTHIGGEVKQLRDNVGKFCEGAIEGAKAIAAVEGKARPRKDPVKLKFPDAYGGKKEENFDNWEASVNSYVYLQHILTEEQVLVAFQALNDEAASFARSFARTAGCENNLVAYSKVTPLPQFFKLLRERVADPTRGVKASDKLQTIHSRQWRSARALKGTMDNLVVVPDHGVTEPQLVQLFYRAMPEPLRGHFFGKSQQSGITYDALSREVVLYESKSMPVSTFWHKDLDKGKRWKGRTISGQVRAKDHMILTVEEGGTNEVPYSQIEWGLEEEDSSVGQGRSYAVVAAGGRPQSRGGGQGQRGQAMGGRGPGAQGVGGQGNRQVGGRGQGPPPNRQGPCLASCPETTCVSVSLGTSLTGVAEELKERMPAWAKMKKESKGQLILVDVEVFRSRVGALIDSGATRSYISRRALKKLRLGLKVQKLADPIVSVLADNRAMRVEDYVEGVQAYFCLEKDGKVEKVLHSLTLLVQDDLPFDIVLGMDWGEAAGATLHLREYECRLRSPSGEAKTGRLFHVSGVDNTLADCCLSAPTFARLVKKEQLEDQVFVVYVRPVTEAKKEDSSTDPTIAKLLEEFKDLTESPTGVVPRPIQHRIEIERGSRTPKGALYRMSPRELEELRRLLDELLEKGWIRPSLSPFGAPVLFVPKKEGELRMCIDYRGLNAITVKNVEPLPRIDDLLDRVQGCKYFSKIDLKFGYHHDDQYKTAFRTRYGHYEFIVMPFGLTNAPTTFQRCMNDLFRPWLYKFVVVYLGDILVFSKTLHEHQGHLRQVLEKLQEANFKINAKKCEWAKTQVLYLGHVSNGDGIKPENSKIAAIRDWPTPHTLTKLRSFLGLANYYRKFVRNFSTIAAPLRKLLKKEAIRQWDKDCTSMLKKLKRALIEYPVLKVADPSLPFVVTMDASQYGIGVVLQQDDDNGYRPVEFMSARMPSEKVATSTYERKLYALRQVLDHWKHYLLGRHFKVYSDHETLRWLKTQAKMTPKLTRWAAEIDQYDFELNPVKGKYNIVADALSRRLDYFGAIVHYLDIGRDLQEKVKQAYAQDPIYSDLLKRVREAPETEPDYCTTEGLLFEKTNVFDHLCVPNSEEIRSLILGECHDTEGHFGWQKTLANLMRAYTWPAMKNDCIEYVRSCKVCQRNKTTTRAPLGLLRPLPIPDQPGDSVSIDFMDTQVKSRHAKSQVMVIVDRFSKYAVFVPLPAEERTDLVIQKFFDFWVSENGIPLSIVSDRDSRFTSQNWQELMRVYGSKLLMSSGRHPETNGQTAQTNKILQQVLRMYIRPDQINWDEMLPKVASAFNNSVHLSTCRTPNELHKSFRPRRPFEGLNRDQIHRLPPGTREFAIQHEKELATVVENLRKAQHRMIEQANKHRRPSQFQVGDLVWVKAKEFAPEENISQKLLPAYRGPWPVLEVKGGEDGPSYTREIPAHLHTYPVFHASKLLPCVTSQQFPSRRSMIPPDMDGSYDIDDIVDEDVFRTGGRGRPHKQYKVQFAYQEPEDDHWFTRTELLETAPDIVRAYEHDKKGKGPALD